MLLTEDQVNPDLRVRKARKAQQVQTVLRVRLDRPEHFPIATNMEK
jgi:hypothetical protein